jgi:hypothetical protein
MLLCDSIAVSNAYVDHVLVDARKDATRPRSICARAVSRTATFDASNTGSPRQFSLRHELNVPRRFRLVALIQCCRADSVFPHRVGVHTPPRHPPGDHRTKSTLIPDCLSIGLLISTS